MSRPGPCVTLFSSIGLDELRAVDAQGMRGFAKRSPAAASVAVSPDERHVRAIALERRAAEGSAFVVQFTVERESVEKYERRRVCGAEELRPPGGDLSELTRHLRGRIEVIAASFCDGFDVREWRRSESESLFLRMSLRASDRDCKSAFEEARRQVSPRCSGPHANTPHALDPNRVCPRVRQLVSLADGRDPPRARARFAEAKELLRAARELRPVDRMIATTLAGALRQEALFEDHFGESGVAAELWDERLALLRTISDFDATEDSAAAVRSACIEVADHSMKRGEPALAVVLYREAAGDPKLYEGPGARDRRRPDCAVELLAKLRDALAAASLIGESLDAARDVVDAQQEIVGRSPADIASEVELAAHLLVLAECLRASGDTAGAVERLDRAERIGRWAVASDTDELRWRSIFGTVLVRRGELALEQGDGPAARMLLKEGVDEFRVLVRDGTGAPDAKWRLALALDELGDAHSQTGDRESSYRLHEEAVSFATSAREADGGEHDELFRQVLSCAADAASAAGELGRALELRAMTELDGR